MEAPHNLAEWALNLYLELEKPHPLSAMTLMQTSILIFQKSKRRKSHQSPSNREQKRKNQRTKQKSQPKIKRVTLRLSRKTLMAQKRKKSGSARAQPIRLKTSISRQKKLLITTKALTRADLQDLLKRSSAKKT